MRTPSLPSLLSLLLLATLLPQQAQAQVVETRSKRLDSERKLRLRVVPPARSDQGKEEAREGIERARIRHKLIHKLGAQAASHTARRLKGAGLRAARVKTLSGGRFEVRYNAGRIDPDWMRKLVMAPGQLSLQPVLRRGEDWLKLSRELPADVEIRQPQGSTANADAFLWSKQRRSLETFLRRISLAGVTTLTVAPHKQGWRSVSLGTARLDHRDLRDVVMSRSPIGMPYVKLRFDKSIAIARPTSDETRHIALLLDGELIGMHLTHKPQEGKPQQSLQLTYPLRAPMETQRLWAAQVAGRLSAPMPLRLLEEPANARSNRP